MGTPGADVVLLLRHEPTAGRARDWIRRRRDTENRGGSATASEKLPASLMLLHARGVDKPRDELMRVVFIATMRRCCRAQLASLFSTRTRGGFANRWVEQVPAARGKYRVCGLIRMHNFDERSAPGRRARTKAAVGRDQRLSGCKANPVLGTH